MYSITDPARVHHLSGVCRARAGDAVSLFSPGAEVYRGVITDITRSEIRVRIESRQAVEPPALHLTLACALPKASGMDEIIDNLTQLGVDSILPMLTERTVTRPEDPAKKLERWQKIALSAAEQSQRTSLPLIHPPMDLAAVLRLTRDCDLKIIPTLEGRNTPLSLLIGGFRQGRVVLLIGPEGDFTPAEVQQALQAGFLPASLGPNVLRVAVAAAAVCAFIKLSVQT